MSKIHALLEAALLALAAGCIAPRTSAPPPPRTPANDIPDFGSSLPNSSAASRLEAPNPTGALTLNTALALALTHSPRLKAFSHDVRAAEARILQAGLRPNPELAIELEEFDRNGEGLDSSEIVVGLGQAIELGGKRAWRKRVAVAEARLADWDYEEARLQVLADTARRFAQVIVAERRLSLAESSMELATNLERAVAARVAAGKEPEFKHSRVKAELGIARLEMLEAKGGLAVARKRLANTWASENPTFKDLDGSIEPVAKSLPTLDAAESCLPRNPALGRQEAALALAKAALGSEQAARNPDLELSASYVQFEEDGTDALVFGISAPLPIFDRNQGGITGAKHLLAGAESKLTAIRAALHVDLAEAYAELVTAHAKVQTLRDEVLPASEKAFNAATEGYAQGKFGYVDVLDAQRAFLAARRELIDALASYHDSLATVQTITCTDIRTIIKESNGGN